MRSRTWWALPLFGAIATYILVMFLSQGQSVWFDEGYSILLAKQSVGELIALTGVDAHPPLFYLLLKAWGTIFGWSEFALRSLSAILVSLAVGGMLLVVRKLFTNRVALVVLPFIVLAPFTLRYGYEIRMYALVIFIGVLATLVMMYAVEQKKIRYWALYAVLVALGMLTLYMSVVVWLAHAIWLFVRWKDKSWRTFFKQPWVLAFIGAAALFAVYVPTLLHQLTHSALPGVGSQLTLTQLANVAGMVAVFTPEYQLNGILSLAIIGIISLTLYLLTVVYVKTPKSQKSAIRLVVALVIVPFLFYAVISVFSPIFITRYIAHIAIYMYALVGIAVALGWRFGKRRVAVVLAALALTVSILGVFQLQSTGNYVFERLQYPEIRQIRETITCNDDTVIVADDPFAYIDSRYYFDGCQFLFFSKDNLARQGGYAPLHDSELRISSPDSLTAKKVIRLGWEGSPNLVPDSRYTLVESQLYDKQRVDIFQLK